MNTPELAVGSIWTIKEGQVQGLRIADSARKIVIKSIRKQHIYGGECSIVYYLLLDGRECDLSEGIFRLLYGQASL